MVLDALPQINRLGRWIARLGLPAHRGDNGLALTSIQSSLLAGPWHLLQPVSFVMPGDGAVLLSSHARIRNHLLPS